MSVLYKSSFTSVGLHPCSLDVTLLWPSNGNSQGWRALVSQQCASPTVRPQLHSGSADGVWTSFITVKVGTGFIIKDTDSGRELRCEDGKARSGSTRISSRLLLDGGERGGGFEHTHHTHRPNTLNTHMHTLSLTHPHTHLHTHTKHILTHTPILTHSHTDTHIYHSHTPNTTPPHTNTNQFCFACSMRCCEFAKVQKTMGIKPEDRGTRVQNKTCMCTWYAKEHLISFGCDVLWDWQLALSCGDFLFSRSNCLLSLVGSFCEHQGLFFVDQSYTRMRMVPFQSWRCWPEVVGWNPRPLASGSAPDCSDCKAWNIAFRSLLGYVQTHTQPTHVTDVYWPTFLCPMSATRRVICQPYCSNQSSDIPLFPVKINSANRGSGSLVGGNVPAVFCEGAAVSSPIVKQDHWEMTPS